MTNENQQKEAASPVETEVGANQAQDANDTSVKQATPNTELEGGKFSE